MSDRISSLAETAPGQTFHSPPAAFRTASSPSAIRWRFILFILLAVAPLSAAILFLGWRAYDGSITDGLTKRDAALRTTQRALESFAASKPTGAATQDKDIVADIRPETLASILAGNQVDDTAFLLIDQNGAILAASRSSQTAHGLDVLAKEFLQGTPSGFQRAAGDRDLATATAAVQGTSWKLLAVTPLPSLRANALWAATPYALALLSILTIFAAVLWLLQRLIVRPLTSMVNYIAAVGARGAPLPAPRVPAAWSVLADKIAEATRNREAHLHQLRAMIDGLPLRAVYVDHDYIYRDANKEFLDFVGLPLEQLAGKSVAEVLGANVQQQYVRLTPSIMAGEVARFEGWIEYEGRGRRYLQVSILPFKALDEEETGFLTFTRDLTELKQAELESVRHSEAFAASDALHRSVVLSAIDGIVVTDEDGITLEFNPAAQTMFGYQATEAVGKPFSDLIVPPELREAYNQDFERHFPTDAGNVLGRRIEMNAMRRDGSLIPIELTITEVKTGQRRLFISHMRNLTNERAKILELNEQREKLHQAEKMTAMGSLLAGVAHELNNPLAVVVAQSTLLEEVAESPALKKRAERIHAAADRCGRIVKTFLAMARQQAPNHITVDLNKIVEAALSIMAYNLRTSGVIVDVRYHHEELLVSADPDQLSQVVSNVLLNAQQAMLAAEPPRRLTVATGRIATGTAFVRIADNGPGVPYHLRDRIFDAYFTTKPVGAGTGIGLAVCRNIARAHGGTLSLEQTRGSGASFLLELPAPQLEPMRLQTPHTGGALSGCTILVVDDEPDVGGTLADLLESMGARADLASTRADAIARIKANVYTLLMSDVRMPDGGGVELRKDLVALGSPLARSMVFVTGDIVAGPELIAESGSGVSPLILEKPFGREDVAAIVRQALERAG